MNDQQYEYKIIFDKMEEAMQENPSMQTIKITKIMDTSNEIRHLVEIINAGLTHSESLNYSSS